MNTKRKVGYLLLSTALIFSPGVVAQESEEDMGFLLEEAPVEKVEVVYTSEIEAGIGWSSENSFKFGEFSGLEDKGAFIIGNFRIQMRDAYDSNGSEYWTLTGTNLGLESRTLALEYGQQGHFSLHASYDQIPKFLLDDARTPYISQNGGTNLVLPAGWVPNDRNASQLTTLNGNLQDLNIEHQRQKFGGGFTWIPRKNWLVKSGFYRELKQGTRTIAAIFGSSGGNPGGAIVAEPVDYETDNLDMSVAYRGKRSQFVLAYNLSVFRDNNTTLTFQNPFASTRWAGAASFPDGFGGIALPPDNKAHRITFSGGYRFNEKTRATANLSYARATQDDAFLGYTVNPNLVVTTPLPRSSLNGEIETTLANLALNSRLSPKLNVSARYRFNNRDNNTPRDVFIVVPGDSQDQGDLTGSTARINLPYDRKQHLFDLNAGYRLNSNWKLSAGYSYEQLERTFSEVAKTREHKFEAKLRAAPSATFSGWVGINYASRTGSDYDDNALFIASHTSQHLGPNPDDEFENHPLVRKFFIADRDRLKVSGAANWMPNDKLAVSIMGRYARDNYDNTQVGLTESTTNSITVDASYNPAETFAWHAFYTFESMGYEQTGFSHRRGTDITDFAAQNWSVDTDDKVNTFGIGFEWTAIKDELDITFDYTYSKANTDYDMTAGTALSFEPLPDLKSTLHSANLLADYQYSENLWLRFRYLLQDFEVVDFALDGIDPDAMARVIGLGNQSPNYTVHVIGVSTIYRF